MATWILDRRLLEATEICPKLVHDLRANSEFVRFFGGDRVTGMTRRHCSHGYQVGENHGAVKQVVESNHEDEASDGQT